MDSNHKRLLIMKIQADKKRKEASRSKTPACINGKRHSYDPESHMYIPMVNDVYDTCSECGIVRRMSGKGGTAIFYKNGNLV